MTVRHGSDGRAPEGQLRSFIEKFDPKDQKLIRSVRSAVRKRFPTANEQTRFIRVEAASQLAHPDVEALIAAAIDQAKTPLPPKGRADFSFGQLPRSSGHVRGRQSDSGVE